jgi:hypothetical protein
MSITHQKTLEVWSLLALELRLQAYNWIRVSTEKISQELEKSGDIHRGEHRRKGGCLEGYAECLEGHQKTSVVHW